MNNNPALVQEMTWCQTGAKPLSESILIKTKYMWLHSIHGVPTDAR